MQPTKEEVELKKFDKLKKQLSAQVQEYEQTKDYELKKEILDTLYFVASSYGGMRIDMGKPSGVKDWNKFTLMPSILRSVYQSLKKKKVMLEAVELYNIAAIVLEDTSET